MIESLPPDHFLIAEILASYLEDWQKGSGQRDHNKRGYFYISDVSKCDRALFYDFIYPEKKRTISVKTLMMFAAGNLIHDDIQSRAKRRDVIEGSRDIEYGVEDWHYNTVGRIDFLAAVYRFIRTENGIAVVEIKTKNAYNFGEEKPTQEEIDQCLWYIDRLKESNIRVVKKLSVLDYGFILYAERSMTASPLPICGWRVDFDPQRITEIKGRFAKLDAAITANQIPMRPYERDSIKCQYCRYLDFCWEGVPKVNTPIFMADESIEKPEEELVKSAAENLIRLKEEKGRIESEVETTENILLRYFKATGIEKVAINGGQIIHAFLPHTILDSEYLLSVLKDKWTLIAAPQTKLIQEAIKNGNIDPEIFERAKRTNFIDQIRIKRLKGGKNADKESKQRETAPEAGQDSPGNQKTNG